MNPGWIVPDWPAPARVNALSTTRAGGCSTGPWHSLNLGRRSGDDPQAVQRNRAVLRESLPAEPRWLMQVHGSRVLDDLDFAGSEVAEERSGDACITLVPGQVCVVLAADCLPVLFCDRSGTRVAAAHAGWRGLAGGILENTVKALAWEPTDLMAWMGPAIGPEAYEVGEDVLAAFAADEQAGAGAFRPSGDRWLFDLYAMAGFRLRRAGVESIHGGGFCTFTESERFFSHRRDRVTGRMASLVWLED